MTRPKPQPVERMPNTRSATPAGQTCAWAGCTAEDIHRAPKDQSLSSYVMFCLEHVRAYNAKWDFHVHMSPTEIEAEIRRTATWDRPTWPLGSKTATARKARPWTRADLNDATINDPMNLGTGTSFDSAQRKKARQTSWADDYGLKTEERKALKVFSIEGPISLAELKNRYKDLVKQHHPDKHGGSPEAEARMKTINSAYQLLSVALRRESGK